MSRGLDVEDSQQRQSVKMKVNTGFMHLKSRNTTDTSKAPEKLEPGMAQAHQENSDLLLMEGHLHRCVLIDWHPLSTQFQFYREGILSVCFLPHLQCREHRGAQQISAD